MGKQLELGLGSYPSVSLAEARSIAAENKALAVKGINPKYERQKPIHIPTFLEVAETVIEINGLALRLCMERIAPAPKDKAVFFPLPEMKDAMDASKAANSVLTAVSEGELTPIEGTRVMGLIDSYRRTLELTEIEERLQVLETAY